MPYRSILGVLCLLCASMAFAQAQANEPASAEKPPLKPEELEQLLAPIALYPDSLLTQMLMASTYPLEIVGADRWVKVHKDLKGDALAKELEKQSWDASVKSLVNFPDQLSMMSEKLDMTQKLGDAFIAQQADVLNTVQVLRNRAQKQGNLKSDEQVKVTSAAAPPAAAGEAPAVTVVQAPPQVITIESASPTVVYVPTYEPAVVYGGWPYPAYPPYPYYPPRPPGYVATAAISFGVGVACGAAWGYAWGNSNWGNNDIDIDVNRNTNFNRNIDRSKYQSKIDARKTNAQGRSGSWQHDPGHRQGVPYRDQKSAQRFGGADQARTAQAREQFRGRADTGRQDLARDQQAGRFNDQNARNGNRSGTPGGERRGANEGRAQDRAGTQSRGSRGDSGSGGAFSGSNRSGSETRAASQRGQSSRSGASSGGARGGSRGGGGGGARGGSRGGRR